MSLVYWLSKQQTAAVWAQYQPYLVLSRRVPGFNLELRKLTGCVETGLFRNKSGNTPGGYGSSIGREHSDSASGESDRFREILDIELIRNTGGVNLGGEKGEESRVTCRFLAGTTG